MNDSTRVTLRVNAIFLSVGLHLFFVASQLAALVSLARHASTP